MKDNMPNRLMLMTTATLIGLMTTLASGQQAAQSSPAGEATACAGEARRARENLASLAERLERARQSNKPADMRAAIDMTAAALTEIRTGLEKCGAPAGRSAPADHSSHSPSSTPPPPGGDPASPTIRVSDRGFEPARLTLPAGRPVRLTFLRVSTATCGDEVVVPDLGIKRSLPLGQPVTIELPASAAREIAFTCGMNMLSGQLVVR